MWISARNITLRAAGREWFPHTTWHIAPRECWAVLGPIGSGKSLLVQALAHHVPLTSGEIRYAFDPADPAPGRAALLPREILTLSNETHREFLQRYTYYHQARWQSFEGEDAPTAADLLEPVSVFRRSPYQSGPQPEEAADLQRARAAALELFDLEPLLERKILHLSHGESRKVHIARLLMQRPRLLILDEPFSGLDAETCLLFRSALDALAQRGEPNLLFVSSRSDLLPDCVTHLLLVEGGRVLAQGPRAELLPRPDLQPFFERLSAQRSSVPERSAPALQAAAADYTADLAQDPTCRAPALVEMHRVSITYGSTPVLHNIDWTLRPGERWALLGHNGAGKSTLLSLILADNPQSYASAVTLFGRPRGSGESIWEIKRRIGWVSPELHLYYRKTITCRDVACTGYFDSLALQRPCTPAQQAAALRWLDALGLSAQAEAPFQSLSTGQQRLALLARALVKHPPLLILDEPCQGLDESSTAGFLALLNELCARTPLALIYVTHDPHEIPAAITHRLQLAHGCAAACGPYSLPPI